MRRRSIKIVKGGAMNKRSLAIAIAGLLILIAIYTFAGEKAATQPQPSAQGQTQPKNTGPETAILDDIVNLYEPVVFTHSNHVGYAGSCETCHHHAGGDTPPCNACHSTSNKVEKGTDTMPDLKAAYHRQCMNCHKQMGSGPVGCTDCHARRKVETKQENKEEKK